MRNSADCRTTPRLVNPSDQSDSKMASVGSVNGEFSMSMRTKNPSRLAGPTIRRRFASATSGEISSPSWVSLSEMFRPMPARAMRSRMRP